MFNKELEKLKFTKLEFMILMLVITIITFLSAFHFLPTYNLKLFLMSGVIILLLIASYLDIKFRNIENLVLIPVIVILSLLMIINIYNNGIGIANLILVMLLSYIYFYYKRKDNIKEIGGADIKILIPMILSFTTIELVVFIMLIGDILFSITVLNRFRNWSIPFFAVITIPYFLIFILNDVIIKIVL